MVTGAAKRKWQAGSAALAAGLAIATVAYAAAGDVELASRAPGADGAKANAGSLGYSISGGGRSIAFDTRATNLDPADTDPSQDVFVRDLQADALELASRAAGAGGAKGNGISMEPVVSADGRFVAFTSSSSNLHPDDPDTQNGVFARDLQTDALVLVSRAAGAHGASANGGSGAPSISADGRFVAFRSSATNLHPDDADSDPDVFVRDLQANTTTLVSRGAGAGGASANGQSSAPSISADGRFVAFSSLATNLHADDGDTAQDVFVRDLQAGTLTLVSRAAGAGSVKANAASLAPAISADGRSVAFESRATNLHADDPDATADVFVRDLGTDALVLVSRAAGAAGAKGNSHSVAPAISADGRFAVFSSSSTNLHADDADTAEDVFVRDLRADTLTLASRAPGAAGSKGDGTSFEPSVSGEGRFVGFNSTATNLHPDDGDPAVDVYVREMALPQEPVPAPATPSPSPEPTVTPAPAPCANGVDDDRDGWADAADRQCRAGRGAEEPADNPILACAGVDLVLTDVLPARRRVRLAGFADRALAGRAVLLYAGTRRIARTIVAADGSFAAGARRRPGRYSARIGRLRSRAYRLQRKAIGAAISRRAGSVTLRARVIGPDRRRGRVALLLGRPGACRAYTVAARRKLPRSGRFAISAPAPPGVAVAVYRARIRLRGRTIHTVPRVLFLR